MECFRYAVSDERGLHARNAMSLCKLAESFNSSVRTKCGDKEADCKNVMALMNLHVVRDDVMEFVIEGQDEEEAARTMKSAVPTIL